MSGTCATYLAIVLSILVVIIFWIKNKYNYWSSKGVTQLAPRFPTGDVILFNRFMSTEFQRVYNNLKSRGEAHGGIYLFLTPIWVPVDIELIKTIMIKDFDYFRNHGLIEINENTKPLSKHLFHLEDEPWRSMRIKLTPTFTSGKMKMMFPTFLSCTNGLTDILNRHDKSNLPLDIKDILARFTTDIISNCAFGLECNSLKNPDEEFRTQMRELLNISGMRKLKLLLVRTLPTFVRRYFAVSFFEPHFENFFIGAIKDIVEYREKNNVFRRDFMHLLLQIKNRGKVTDDEMIKEGDKTREHLNISELAAQCFVFFVAGFETSSSAMTYALYELSKNQNVQAKLRKEIREVSEKHQNKFTYEAITEMTYLDLVVKETLRKYPPIGIIPRKCTKNYKVPGSNAVIEKGTLVKIPVWPIHMDAQFYPEPEKFDPDRFTKENEMKRPAFTWMPFGEGPRLCIGMRFGLLQTKVGLATIIKDFNVKLNAKTPTTLKMVSDLLIAQSKDKILLDVEKV